jgi:hypothetical protein
MNLTVKAEWFIDADKFKQTLLVGQYRGETWFEQNSRSVTVFYNGDIVLDARTKLGEIKAKILVEEFIRMHNDGVLYPNPERKP